MPKIIKYLKTHELKNILAAGLVTIAAIGIMAIGIVDFSRIMFEWFSSDFTDVHISLYGQAFNIMLAEALLAILLLLPSIPIFLTGYLIGESHPLGKKLSFVLAAILISLAFTTDSFLFFFTAALCIFAAVLELTDKVNEDKKAEMPIITENVAKFGLRITGLISVVILFGVIIYIFIRGSKNLTWEFLTGTWDWGVAQRILAGRETGEIGGLSHHIIGSLLLVVVCELFALPLGVGSAIYLSEYSSDNKLTNTIRFFIETLAGVPSIIFGLLGLLVFVTLLGFDQSLIAGGLALALMILPWNIRVVEEAMKAVPQSYREASYALGATKWQTIKTIVLYAASPGVITGILLGIGAAIGETAVLIWTTGAEEATRLPTALVGYQARVPSVAVWIYNAYVTFSVSNVPLWVTQNVSLAGSCVLLIIFLAISGIALIIRNYLSKKIRGQ